jgi:hypothetical protein
VVARLQKRDRQNFCCVPIKESILRVKVRDKRDNNTEEE